MEESADERCSVVYFCASASGDVYELHHASALEPAVDGERDHTTSGSIYDNVRILLDEDQGGFHEGEAAFCFMRPAHTVLIPLTSLCKLAR